MNDASEDAWNNDNEESFELGIREIGCKNVHNVNSSRMKWNDSLHITII